MPPLIMKKEFLQYLLNDSPFNLLIPIETKKRRKLTRQSIFRRNSILIPLIEWAD